MLLDLHNASNIIKTCPAYLNYIEVPILRGDNFLINIKLSMFFINRINLTRVAESGWIRCPSRGTSWGRDTLPFLLILAKLGKLLGSLRNSNMIKFWKRFQLIILRRLQPGLDWPSSVEERTIFLCNRLGIGHQIIASHKKCKNTWIKGFLMKLRKLTK